MSARRVLIDASNLHSGGGVQVAASFMNELGRLVERPEWFDTATFRVSSSVAANLEPQMLSRVETRDVHPSLDFLVPRRNAPFDVVLNVFGPTFRRREGRVEIAGFADPTVPPGYAAAEAFDHVQLHARIKTLIKRVRVRSFDHLVVETETFARSLSRFGVDASRVTVVPNAASEVVLAAPRGDWTYASVPGELTFLYPSRPYRHKNHEFLGPFVAELGKHGISARVLVTLTKEELAALSPLTQRACRPMGVVTQAELAALYGKVDGVVFPSLLEVASATPLEALGTATPFFGADRDFIRDQTGEVGWYFDPLDPRAAAELVRQAFADPAKLATKVEAGLEIAASRPTARERAVAYVGLIDKFLASPIVAANGSKARGSRRIWVAHPVQQHSMRTAAAVKTAGFDLTYFTPVYDRPGALTHRFKVLLRGDNRVRVARRRNDALADDDVVQVHEGLALVLLLLQRLPGSRTPFNAWLRLLAATFNARLARRAAREQPAAVIAYDTFAAGLFERLRRSAPSTVRILDMSAPAAPYMGAVLGDLAGDDPGRLGVDLRAEAKGLFYRVNLRYTRREIVAAEHFFVASEFTAGSLRALGVPGERIHMCRYGAPAPSVPAAGGRVGGGPIRVAYVGTCTPRKGIAQFLELARTMGPGFEFVAIGALRRESPVPSEFPQVRWTGHLTHDQVMKELEQTDVLYFPSLGDGFGFAVVEAMGAGNVVLCSANAGASDVVVEGENGFVVPAGESCEAAQHLRVLAADRPRLLAMQDCARRTAAGLTWQSYDAAVAAAVRVVLEGATRP